jgi:hypothetical protein
MKRLQLAMSPANGRWYRVSITQALLSYTSLFKIPLGYISLLNYVLMVS